MQKNEARQLVVDTFTHAFSEKRFTRFVRNLLPGLQAASTHIVPNAQLPQGFREHVNSYTRVGTYHDPQGDVLDVVIVKLKRKASLERARTRQRNLMAHYLNRRRKDAVLVAYITDDLSDWRFSYVKLAFQTEVTDKGRVKVKQEFTPARRYSFLVGEHEPNHTAQKQLGDLFMQEVGLTLDQIEEAFNIESVTKEFFEDYKSLFLQIKENLDQIVASNQKGKAEFERCEIDTANFAKKLLGQIVFLYFLQKKGWLGVAKDEAWGTGDKRFLYHLFLDNKDKNFFDDILEPFFYEALAIERSGDYYPALACKIPFLNGGLFEPLHGYDWENTCINLNNQVFEKIFDVFNLYNFTVREDEPLEKEVAVDPEMLGKVFENLLEIKDRKSKGAYYTPREIVHYMCQESLINYLDTTLNLESQKVAKEDIEDFIREGDLSIERDQAREEGKLQDDKYGLPESIREHAKEIDFALADVKICDPAIGSGAFPVGMMTEIVRARTVLTPYLDNQRSRDAYTFKWHCIENSLYGVDIDSSAVEIAKLRLWLSLVVDEESYDQIRPLPNLDYRIVRGNSLEHVQKDMFFHLHLPEFEKKKIQYYGSTSKKNKETLKSQIEELIYTMTVGDLSFDFEIHFSEVFSKKSGFDVVIANPPYVFTRGSKFSQKFKDFVKTNYETGQGKINLFALFIERGVTLLSNMGILTYIAPNTLFRATTYKPLRKFILDNTKIEQIVDLENEIFAATVSTTILILVKNKIKNYQINVIDSIKNLRVHSVSRRIPVDIFKNRELIFRIFVDDLHISIFNKIEGQSRLLGEITRDIVEGIVTPKGKSDFISHEQKNDNYKPFLEGKDINSYEIKYKNKYILFDRQKLHRARADYIWMAKEKLLIRRISGGDKVLFVAYDDKNYYTFASINNLLLNDNTNFNIKYILGLLNSKLLNWYYIESFTNRSKLTVNISKTYLDLLPIKELYRQDQEIIIRLVDKIIRLKESCQYDKATELEREIDNFLYKIYDLKEDEKAIIEESVGR